MLVAAIQLAMNDERSKQETTAYALSMMDRCKGADLILLPEVWNIGFLNYDLYHSESEPLDGPTASALAAKAVELNAWVYGGSLITARDGKYYNTSLLFDRKGELVAFYDKIHLFSYKSREAELLTPGREIRVVDTEFGKVGLSICYDLRFPELYRAQTAMGAEIFLVTASWGYPKEREWNLFTQVRALENFCYQISCGVVGVQQGVAHMGHSKIVDPWGTVVAGSDYREAIVKAEIDPGLVRRAREEFPVLRDRVF